MTRNCLLTAFLTLAAPACAGDGHGEGLRHDAFAVGMTRIEIRERFGEPVAVQTMTKSGEAVWGPIESFWSEVPDGAGVEIWSFPSVTTLDGGDESLEQRGRTELYFVDGSETVDGIGFHLEGAVYEAR